MNFLSPFFSLWYDCPMAKQKKRGWLIALLVVAIVIGAFLLIVLPLVNRKAEELIKEALLSPGMIPLSYSEISVNALRGQAACSELQLPLAQDGSLSAKQVLLSLPVREVAAIAIGQREELTKADIEIADLSYDNPNLACSAQSATIALRADKMEAHALDVMVQDRLRGFSYLAQEINLQAFGSFSMDLLSLDEQALLQQVGQVAFSAMQGKVEPDERIMAQLAPYSTVSTWLVEEENWTYYSLVVEGRMNGQDLYVDSFVLQAPLVNANGKASFSPADINVQVTIQSLHEQVRGELAHVLSQVGQRIPEGPFSLEFSQVGKGMPRITIR